MDYDEAIEKALREIRKRGRKEITIHMLEVLTDLSPQVITRKLKKFEKFGILKRKKRRPITFFEVLDI